MARDRAPSFQLYPRDFVEDTAVMVMSLAALGAYARLFMRAWDQPEPGVLPGDDRRLAMMAQASPAEWRRVRAEVATAFDTESRPGCWVQKRMVAVRAEQVERFQRASEAGRRGNATRWGPDA